MLVLFPDFCIGNIRKFFLFLLHFYINNHNHHLHFHCDGHDGDDDGDQHYHHHLSSNFPVLPNFAHFICRKPFNIVISKVNIILADNGDPPTDAVTTKTASHSSGKFLNFLSIYKSFKTPMQ